MNQKPSSPRPERADAQKKRAQVLAAAADLFATQGLELTLDTVARHAGVGIGTVYRKYESVEQLAGEVFIPRMISLAEAARSFAEQAAAAPEEAFRGWIWTLAEIMATEPGFAQLMLTKTGLAGVSRCEDFHRAAMAAFEAEINLLQQVKQAGLVHPGFTRADIGLLLFAIRGLVTQTADPALSDWRQLTSYLLTGFFTWRPQTSAATPV
ncbi:MAG: TetR/AcrR family transcriptional regulator [Actinomycetaceae bacterium]|nr:TetR/AcrR family transcriptional regulator [Actinomycetaceae bacterium]